MSWTPDISEIDGPIYRAIAEAIAREVAAGVLSAGDRLPSQRDLARRLGVDLTTVTRAYAYAARSGVIESDGRRGSFVRARTVTMKSPETMADQAHSGDTGMNMPPEPEGGRLAMAIRDGLIRIAESEAGLPMHYQPSGGTEQDRAIAAELLFKDIPATVPEQVVVTAGGQNALHAICGALVQPGARVAAGCFTYPGFLALARRLGMRIVPVAMDDEGLIPEALDAAARDHSLDAVYVVPTNDNPTTATMGKARRMDIAAIAERYGMAIIEDDAYGQLPERLLAPIAAYAPTRTWHIASVSKAISPGLRVAFVRAPSVRDALRLAVDVHETAIMAPPLNIALVCQWLRDGMYQRLVALIRAESAARQQMAAEILSGASYAARPEGYHLWLPVPYGANGGPDGLDLIASAVSAGLPVVPSSAFAAEKGAGELALRVSLGGGRSRERVARDLRRLDALLAASDRRNHAFV